MLNNLIKIACLAAMLFVLEYLFPRQNLNDSRQFANVSEALPVAETVKELPSLEAKAACVFDLTRNEYLFKLNSEESRPLASLTKLLTAITAKENFPAATMVEISKEAISQEGDSGLNAGEKWQLSEITDVMLISSSNDAAFSIGNSIRKDAAVENSEFVKLMNKEAKKIGLKDSYFFNTTGLDISDTLAGGYGSCRDITILMAYILKNHPGLLETTTQPSLYLQGREFKNTNELLPKLPLLLAGKTGYDDLAGGNLTIAVNKGLQRPIIITVLGSSFEGRFTDVEALYEYFAK